VTSGAGAEVLSAMFPGEIELSRPYAGIHYRFDIDAGLSLGERVARVSLDADAKGRLVTSLR
jgi:hypothetical protein